MSKMSLNELEEARRLIEQDSDRDEGRSRLMRRLINEVDRLRKVVELTSTELTSTGLVQYLSFDATTPTLHEPGRFHALLRPPTHPRFLFRPKAVEVIAPDSSGVVDSGTITVFVGNREQEPTVNRFVLTDDADVAQPGQDVVIRGHSRLEGLHTITFRVHGIGRVIV